MEQDHGASADADRAGGLRPEPAAQSQPKALIPSALTIWPFGHGVVLTAPAYPTGEGSDAAALFIRAVPDDYIAPLGDGDPKAAWRAASVLDGPVAVLTFKDAAAIERLRVSLANLASGIEAASADETRSGSAEGESPAPERGDAQ